jgi:hypothetical protein
VLGQAFHSGWQAYANWERLEHFTAMPFGWANAFYLPYSGEYEIEIIFENQQTLDAELVIWALTWISIVTAIIYLAIGKKVMSQVNLLWSRVKKKN